MKLYKRQGGSIWQASVMDGHGKRVRVSTGCTDYDEAMAKARSLLAPALLDNSAEELDALAALKKEVTDDIIAAPDAYAAIVKNAEAQQKMLEAELKALKEEQQAAVARLQAKINRKAGKVEFFKEAIAVALRAAGINKIGGAKTDNRFSIYFQESTSVDVDAEKVLAPYQPRINAFIQSLPSWITIKTDVSKTELKKADEMPEGASLVSSSSLRIR